MELITLQLVCGLIVFFIGILSLNYCNLMERKNFNDLKRRRTLKWYGRREKDAQAPIQHDGKGSLMALGGATLSMVGLIIIFQSISWTV